MYIHVYICLRVFFLILFMDAYAMRKLEADGHFRPSRSHLHACMLYLNVHTDPHIYTQMYVFVGSSDPNLKPGTVMCVGHARLEKRHAHY